MDHFFQSYIQNHNRDEYETYFKSGRMNRIAVYCMVKKELRIVYSTDT